MREPFSVPLGLDLSSAGGGDMASLQRTNTGKRAKSEEVAAGGDSDVRTGAASTAPDSSEAEGHTARELDVELSLAGGSTLASLAAATASSSPCLTGAICTSTEEAWSTSEAGDSSLMADA